MRYLKFWLKVLSFLLLWGILLPRFVHAQAGSPDPTFGGGDGYAITSFLANGHASPSAVVIQPNGRIVMAGSTWIPDGTSFSKMALARYMPNGTLDPTFGVGGRTIITNPTMGVSICDLLVLPDGKFFCTGWGWTDTQSYFMVARLNADGTPDNSYDNDGVLTFQVGNYGQGPSAMVRQSDGKIVVAGYANLSGYDEFALIRFNPNGTFDNSFGGGDGILTTPVGEASATAEDVLIQPDGKIVVAGIAVANGYEDFTVVRYNTNGTLDNSFSGDGIAMMPAPATKDRLIDIALQPDGKMVLTGYTSPNGLNQDVDLAVARLMPNGTPDPSFGNGSDLTKIHVTDRGDYATSVVIQPDGKILIAGHSQHFEPSTNGTPYHFTLARLTANGLPDLSFGQNNGISIFPVSITGDFIHAMVMQSDGKVVVVGDARFNDLNTFVIARFLIGLTVDTNTPEIYSGKISLYPNPVHEQATLEYELKTAEKITIDLYDVQGRFIQNLLPLEEKTAGKHNDTFYLDNQVPAGNYLVVLETENGRTPIKFTLLK